MVRTSNLLVNARWRWKTEQEEYKTRKWQIWFVHAEDMSEVTSGFEDSESYSKINARSKTSLKYTADCINIGHIFEYWCRFVFEDWETEKEEFKKHYLTFIQKTIAAGMSFCGNANVRIYMSENEHWSEQWIKRKHHEIFQIQRKILV